MMTRFHYALTVIALLAFTTGQRVTERQRRRLRDDDGLGTLEYVLLGAIILAAVAAVAGIFGSTIRQVGAEIQGIVTGRP